MCSFCLEDRGGSGVQLVQDRGRDSTLSYTDSCVQLGMPGPGPLGPLRSTHSDPVPIGRGVNAKAGQEI